MSDQPENNDGSTWNWAYLIPLTALMIPILAVIGFSGADFLPILEIIVAAVAVTLGVRSVLGYRHRLRMEELEAQKELARIEAQQLTVAERVLDLDEGTEQLRQQIRKEQSN